MILEENGRSYFEDHAMLAFKRAEEAGFQTEEKMQDHMECRRLLR